VILSSLVFPALGRKVLLGTNTLDYWGTFVSYKGDNVFVNTAPVFNRLNYFRIKMLLRHFK